MGKASALFRLPEVASEGSVQGVDSSGPVPQTRAGEGGHERARAGHERARAGHEWVKTGHEWVKMGHEWVETGHVGEDRSHG